MTSKLEIAWVWFAPARIFSIPCFSAENSQSLRWNLTISPWNRRFRLLETIIFEVPAVTLQGTNIFQKGKRSKIILVPRVNFGEKYPSIKLQEGIFIPLQLRLIQLLIFTIFQARLWNLPVTCQGMRKRSFSKNLQTPFSYCSWFRNPTANHRGCRKPCKKW